MGKAKKRPGTSSRNDSDVEMKEGSPLPKLVLKVGSKEKNDYQGSPHPLPRQEVDHSHHKKKKKKHKHREEIVEKKPSSKKRDLSLSETINEADPGAAMKKINLRVSKEKEKKVSYKEEHISAMCLCLENLHRNLQRKDVYGIFTFPVTDLIAPGYSKIIKTPMDFLTMSKRITENEYTSLDEFRDDYVVMCNNAMLYNGSDTIYYKSAEKMLSLGLKMLSKEKLVKLNKSIRMEGQVADSDSEEENVNIDESSDVNIDTIMSAEEGTHSPQQKRRRENRQASVTASILAAARKAREDVMKKHPKQLYGFLSKDMTNQMSLNILNPDTSEENKSLPVTIGKLAGKLRSGIVPGQAVIKEEKKNKVVPVNYLMYGPYGSFGPTYDASLSNTTKEESDLLLQAYGSEGGVEYVKSIKKFTEGAPLARDYVDRILDTLTGGAHTRFMDINSKPVVPEEKIASVNVKPDSNIAKNSPKESPTNVDISSLLTLDGVGIDVSFLRGMVKPAEPIDPAQKLAQNADMLQALKQSQNARLSTKTGGIIPIPAGEIKVAASITDNLKDLMGMVRPRDVISSEGVRKGIGMGNSGMQAEEKPVEEGTPVDANPVVAIQQVLNLNENKQYLANNTVMETS